MQQSSLPDTTPGIRPSQSVFDDLQVPSVGIADLACNLYVVSAKHTGRCHRWAMRRWNHHPGSSQTELRHSSYLHEGYILPDISPLRLLPQRQRSLRRLLLPLSSLLYQQERCRCSCFRKQPDPMVIAATSTAAKTFFFILFSTSSFFY